MFLQWQRFDVIWSIKSKNLGQSRGFLAQSPYLRIFIMFATETSVDNFCVALQHFMLLEKHHLLRCHCSCEVFSAGSGRGWKGGDQQKLNLMAFLMVDHGINQCTFLWSRGLMSFYFNDFSHHELMFKCLYLYSFNSLFIISGKRKIIILMFNTKLYGDEWYYPRHNVPMLHSRHSQMGQIKLN